MRRISMFMLASCWILTSSLFSQGAGLMRGPGGEDLEAGALPEPPAAGGGGGGGSFVRGDGNGDGVVNISDALYVLGYLFSSSGSEPDCLAALDANDDEKLDLTDAVRILNYLFLGATRPPAPFPAPGPDPTPGLGCGVAPMGPEAPSTDDAFYARISLRLTDAGVDPVDARVIPGSLAAGNALVGDLVYALYAGPGDPIAVGSLEDPRLVRGTAPEGEEAALGHSFSLLQVASFSIKVSSEAMAGKDLSRAQLFLYERGDASAELQTLDVETFLQVQKDMLQPLHTTPAVAIGAFLLPAVKEFQAGGKAGGEVGGGGLASSTTVTPLLINGPTSAKRNLVVIGDGFAASDQVRYNQLVEDLVMKGVFGHDFFHETAAAFNIFRINAISRDSGVTTGKHAFYISNSVMSPSSRNLGTGSIRVTFPGGLSRTLTVNSGNASLAEVAAGLQAMSFRLPGCGGSTDQGLYVRLDVTSRDTNGDGVPESFGVLKIGAPGLQFGSVGDISVAVSLSGGSSLTFRKTGTPARTDRNTAFDYVYTGEWDYCWLQGGCNTDARIADALALVPDYDYVVVLLNDPRSGGCGGGGFQVVPSGVGWATLAHEFGHGVGGLTDEYTSPGGTYTGGRPLAPNLDNVSSRATIKWKDFIDPATPLPTRRSDVSSSNQDVGAFVGGGTQSAGIFRPVDNCRMNGNSPEFCPVCYHQMRTALYPYQQFTFRNAYTGDFDGDGRDDLVQHDGRTLALFLSDGTTLRPKFFAADHLPAWGWEIRPNDRYFVGDINGDGRDDLYVYNGANWSIEYLGCLRSLPGGDGFELTARYDGSIPGYEFQPRDQLYPADFDGDGRDDLYVFNGLDWSPEYLSLMRSDGNGLRVLHTYEGGVSGWDLENHDRFYPGDFDNDGRVDLYVHNATDWSVGYLGMLRSNGTELASVRTYEQALPERPGEEFSGLLLQRRDQVIVGDFSGDGRDDVYIFNGLDGTQPKLALYRSTGAALVNAVVYTDNLPGWDMERQDTYSVADFNGDHRADLYVYNAANWDTEYLGMLRSTGTALVGTWQDGWIGGWNLGRGDALLAADWSGDGADDLIIRNTEWLGLLRSLRTTLSLSRIYRAWIHNFNFYAPLGHG